MIRLTDFEELRPLVVANARIKKKLNNLKNNKKGENMRLAVFV